MSRVRLKVMLAGLILVAIAAAFSACGASEVAGGIQGSGSSPGSVLQNSSAGSASQNSSGASSGTSSLWPDYIPDDIPALDTNIRKVMEGGTGIRIFYQDLSREQIDDYLRRLQDAGFKLQYLVYYDERYPDNPATKQRMERGEYDAVDITKGDYHLNIGYVPGDVFLDVDSSGFEESYPNTPDTAWPADLAGVLPQPERCRMEAVYAQASGGYQIVCTPEDDRAVADYVAALEAAGYLPTQSPKVARPDVAGAYPDVYSRGDVEVTVDYPPSTSMMRITVWPVG